MSIAANNPNEEPLAAKKAKNELIIDKLQVKEDALSVLQSLDEDQIQELLAQGGSGKDLLNVLVNSVEKAKATEISAVFNACQVFFLYLTAKFEEVAENNVEDRKKFQKLGIELCREILEDHIG